MNESKYILGIDISATSIGWSSVTSSGLISSILASGVRVFPAGTTGDIDKGRDASRNVERRTARQARRQTHRRAARVRAVFKFLQKQGMLPAGNGDDPKTRHQLLTDLDAQLATELKLDRSRLPYLLRAAAVTGPLPPMALGRALFHMAQRRGFLSNRRRPVNEDKEGVVKQGIAELRTAMKGSTLGHFFSKTSEKIRCRYTARDMFESEFEAIVQTQPLPRETAIELRHLLFFQRPLRSSSHLIGECELEPGRKRAPLALLSSQEFRLLQRVNDLRAEDDNGAETFPITAAHRKELVRLLENGDLTWTQVRAAIGAARTIHFNLERGGEKTLIGNRTAAKLKKILGEAWNTIAPSGLVHDLITIEEPKGIARRAREVFGLSEEQAKTLSELTLEPGYLALSRKAVEKLLPDMRNGKAFATAKSETYPSSVKETVVLGTETSLPRVNTLPRMRNPLVERALSELRAVINLLIKEHGKPVAIHVRLARQLRQPRKIREKVSREQRTRHGDKSRAAEKLLKELGVQDAPGFMIERVLLAEECSWRCPWTGKPISVRGLIGDTPDYYVRYILPFARTLDGSFANKTLCHHSNTEQNGKLPAELLTRVESFVGKFAKEKLRRFRMTDEDVAKEYDENYAERYDRDSSYAAKAAARYLSLLGVPVMSVRGGAAQFIRGVWGLNEFFKDDRADYRAQVISATCVALTSPALIRRLTRAAVMAPPGKRHRFADVELPWPGFREELRGAAEKVIVSFRVKKRVRGALHEQTHYSLPMTDSKGKEFHFIRKPVATLATTEIPSIASEITKMAIIAWLKSEGVEEPRKAKGFPVAPGGHPIRKVRLIRREETFSVGSGDRIRHVTSERNHHLVVRQVKEKWQKMIVSQYQAQRRRVEKKPVVERPEGFQFSLAVGEILRDADGKLFRVRGVSKDPQIAYVTLHDARKQKDMIEAKEFYRDSIERLRAAGMRKVVVDPIGRVRNAND
jgi:CRISPR-associated endonuclease Csn1